MGSLLKTEAVANPTLPRWHCMVYQNLTVLFKVHNSISLDKNADNTGCNTASKHDRASTVFLQMAVDTHCSTSLLIS